MTLLDACAAGLAGAAAVEVAELYLATKRVNDFPWRIPGEARFGIYLFSVVLRLALGLFAAWFCARTGPIDTAGAVAAGVAAPKILEQLGHFSPRDTASAQRSPRSLSEAASNAASSASAVASVTHSAEPSGERGSANAPH